MVGYDDRVSYSDLDEDRRVTPQAILGFCQDSCIFQSEDDGVGIDYMRERHIAWILNSWEVLFFELPGLGQDIRTSTWPYVYKDFYANRNFTMKAPDGKLFAAANSVWVLMDTEKMRPARVPEEIVEAYREDTLPMIEYAWAGRKISVPDGGEERPPILVPRSFLDTNRHMNNCKYVEVATDCLPEGFSYNRLRVEYRKSAMMGDELCPVVYPDSGDGRVTVAIRDSDGRIDAIVEYSRLDGIDPAEIADPA